jgi:hypothetical protein
MKNAVLKYARLAFLLAGSLVAHPSQLSAQLTPDATSKATAMSMATASNKLVFLLFTDPAICTDCAVMESTVSTAIISNQVRESFIYWRCNPSEGCTEGGQYMPGTTDLPQYFIIDPKKPSTYNYSGFKSASSDAMFQWFRLGILASLPPKVLNLTNNQTVSSNNIVLLGTSMSTNVPIKYVNYKFNADTAWTRVTTTNKNWSVPLAASAGTNRITYYANGNNTYEFSRTNTLTFIYQTNAVITPATVTLGSLTQTYDGTARTATATTTPSGLSVSLTYNGSTVPPTNAGSYTVIGTVTQAGYSGGATNTLVVQQAAATVTFASTNQTYNGTARTATATTTPPGLPVTLTYNGSSNAPTNAGTYTLVGTVVNPNYAGNAIGTLFVDKAAATLSFQNINQVYSGSAKTVTPVTTPAGLPVVVTYGGSANGPTNAGNYSIAGTINDANYAGGASGTLFISKATATVMFYNTNQVYTGSQRVVTASTSPSGLPVTITYNGSVTAPIPVGNYTIVGTVQHANYVGGATNTLFITATPITLSITPSNQVVREGATASFTASATGGSGSIGYQWRFWNGSNWVNTVSGSSLTLTNVTRATAGWYSCLASDSSSTVSNQAGLWVWAPTARQYLAINLQGPVDLSWCIESVTNLSNPNWNPFTNFNVNIGSNGPVILVNPALGTTPQRFFRPASSQ